MQSPKLKQKAWNNSSTSTWKGTHSKRGSYTWSAVNAKVFIACVASTEGKRKMGERGGRGEKNGRGRLGRREGSACNQSPHNSMFLRSKAGRNMSIGRDMSREAVSYSLAVRLASACLKITILVKTLVHPLEYASAHFPSLLRILPLPIFSPSPSPHLSPSLCACYSGY